MKEEFLWERQFNSASEGGLKFTIARVSLGRRLTFLASNSSIIQKLRYLVGKDDIEALQEKIDLELRLCRSLLSLCVLKIEGIPFSKGAAADWLVDCAPQALCTEVIEAVFAEFMMTPDKKKS